MKDLFGTFFKNKKVLITGHTGFIGSWLVTILNELSAKIIGYALPPYTEQDNFVVSKLKDKITHIIGDIRNFKKVTKTFKQYEPDIVFHLAAQPLVRRSYEIPRETYEVNIGGTVNVLEAFRNSISCKLLVNFTTDKVYESFELERGYAEDDRLGGYDPYSSSKACSELITTAYRNSYFNPEKKMNSKYISSVRCGNVIGGGDWRKDRLIPDCMRAILKNQEIIVRNPDSIRPWQYVLEPIRGLLILAIKMWEGSPIFSNPWNFGPDKDSIFSVKNIVEKIIKYFGKGKYKIASNQISDDFHETKLLLLDSNKANKYLGWNPKITIDDSIEFLCEWYREQDTNYDFNVMQIKEYFKKIKS